MTEEQTTNVPTPPTAPSAPEATSAPVAPTVPSAPAAPAAQPAVQEKSHKKLIRIIGGLVVAAVVLALKFGAIAGVIGLFKADDHKVKDAEAVVDTFSTEGDVTPDPTVVGGDAKKVVDGSCMPVFNGSEYKYTTDKSSKNSDGSATVQVSIKDGPKMIFHLVDTSGSWKIDNVHCR